MDILKSEILRKRQLVEDRNLLVVSPEVLEFGLEDGVTVLGVGERAVVLRGFGAGAGLTDLPLSRASCRPRGSKG